MPINLSKAETRGNYGEIVNVRGRAKTAFIAATKLLDEAAEAGLLPKAYYCHLSRTRSESLNYDIYDFAPGMVLVQKRFTKMSKYGSSSRKDYYIISSGSGGLTIENIEYAKMLVVRTAKAELPYGFVLDRVIHRRETRKMAELTQPRKSAC